MLIGPCRRGGYGQDYFTLRSTYFQGRPPKSVNMYWRRFVVAGIPAGDLQAFEHWIMQRWLEKDALLEHYAQHGRFPTSDEMVAQDSATEDNERPKKEAGRYIETEVKLGHWIEVGQIFVALAGFGLAWALLLRVWRAVFGKGKALERLDTQIGY